MNLHTEEHRILVKIKERRTFQSETWDRLDFIMQALLEAGYDQHGKTQLVSQVSKCGKFFLMKPTQEKVTVQASEFLGKYIQVEFHKLS